MCDWWEVNQSGQMLQCQQHLFRLEKTWRISLSSQTLVAIGIDGYFFQANIKRVSAKFRQILMSSLHPLPMKIKKKIRAPTLLYTQCVKGDGSRKNFYRQLLGIYTSLTAFFFISLLAAYLLMKRMLTYTEKA